MKHTDTVCELCDEMSSVYTYTYHSQVMYVFQERLNCVDLERYDLPTQVALCYNEEAVEPTTSNYITMCTAIIKGTLHGLGFCIFVELFNL